MSLIQISNGCIFIFSLGGQNKVLMMTDRKMNRSQFFNKFLKDLDWVSNLCKFHRNWTKIEGVIVIYPYGVKLTPKMIFAPCDPPGGPKSKIFCLVISLRVIDRLGPKLTQNSILHVTILIQFLKSPRVKSCFMCH